MLLSVFTVASGRFKATRMLCSGKEAFLLGSKKHFKPRKIVFEIASYNHKAAALG